MIQFRQLYRLIIILISVQCLIGQAIPTDYWVYESIRKIQILGSLQELPLGSKPYSRSDIASELVKLKQDQSTQIVKRHPEYLHLILEFENEIRQVEGFSSDVQNESIYTAIGLLSRLIRNNQPQLALQARINYTIYSHLCFQYGAIMDQALNSDPSYTGNEWRGITGYQDQLFLQFENTYVKATLGRDYIDWGYGHSGSLFITDKSRPFDMMKITANGKLVRFESFIAQLDKMQDAERYLTATRLAINPRPHIALGFGQSALYGGINRSLDFTISNPLAFYSFSQDNDQKYMNMMLYADFAVSINQSCRIYGELLIDDFQIDRDKQSDLEPNEIAFIVGGEGVSLFRNLDLWIEYTQVRNRTYNVPEIRPWEKFLHRGEPIAHPYGTDFQLLVTNGEMWLNPSVQSYISLSALKKGEGTVDGLFTEPWMADDVSLDSGFSESIPSGVIETTYSAEMGILWRPQNYFYLDLAIRYEAINNEYNISGQNSADMTVLFQLAVDYDKLFSTQ